MDTLRRFLLFFVACITLPISADAGWKRIDDRLASAADFFDQQRGLVSFIGVGATNIITKFDSAGNESGVYSASQTVTSIAIQDTGSAWAVVGNKQLLHGTKAWTNWVPVHTSTSAIEVVFATPKGIFVIEGGVLKYTADGSNFITTLGFPASDLQSMDYLDGSSLFAATSDAIYASSDSGRDWRPIKTQLKNVKSIFADRVHGILYAGGDVVMISQDGGATWNPLTPPLSMHALTLDGQVFGVHDCTGTFYISNGVVANGDVLRSTDQAVTLVTAGRFPASESDIRKGFVFDRGSTFFWWNRDGAISVTHNGIDSLIVEGLVPEFFANATPIEVSLCPDPTTKVELEFNTSICTPIQVDSITVLSASGIYNAKVKPFLVSQDSVKVQLPYTATHAGLETTMLRVWYRTLAYPQLQSKDIAAQITTTSYAAKLTVPDSLPFGSVMLDSMRSKTLTITNGGCDTLRLDSVVSTNPDLYSVDQLSYPIRLKNGASIKIQVHFRPNQADSTIEALEIGSSAGHRFIELSGAGTKELSIPVKHEAQAYSIQLYPNPASSSIAISASKDCTMEISDALGRLRKRIHMGLGTEEISVTDLPNGEYFIRAAGSLTKFLIAR